MSTGVPLWERWGPYVSERAWGTVREDYSENGDAWNFFPHDHARKRAFRWGEDAIAGFCDRYQVLIFAPVFWNGNDPILKERLFGLNPYEGNHGEDVKELYYHLDGTPTSSYLKYLYKYPQQKYPYTQLIEENQLRRTDQPEYELIDTGIFKENCYFDLFIEYAKASPEDICIRIEAINRGPKAAPLHVLPQLWFRNQWGWEEKPLPEPIIKKGENGCLIADDQDMGSPYYLLAPYHLGKRYLYADSEGKMLFTNNETNQRDLWNLPNRTPYVKDAFHRYLIEKEIGAVNPNQKGTKAAIHYFFEKIESGKSKILRLRLTPNLMKTPLKDVDLVIEDQKKKADHFYQAIHPLKATEEEKQIQRQALAGLIWNQQMYFYAVHVWLNGDNPLAPPPEERKWIRNTHWRHLVSMRILSMPDKWEYPWFAAWDLTFHSLSLALLDFEFAKQQLWILLFDQFQHPNGAIPAYEWNFSEINPPVQAWAALKIFLLEKKKNGTEDLAFLEKCFHKLLLNFAWWVNKVDSLGHNVFEGGFLGLDNIGFLDRSEKLSDGFLMDQADGAGWVALLCLNMMRIALILAKKNPVYEGLGIKFFQHFVHIAAGVRKGQWRTYDMWDDEDGFFHSFLRSPEGEVEKIPIRSVVGIIPFFALDVWEEEEFKQFPNFYLSYQWMVQKNGELTQKCVHPITHGKTTHYLLVFLNPQELSKFLATLWNPNEFRSPYGLRSLSKHHQNHPAQMQNMQLGYEPAEALEKIKGGNSNWRGPIWFPINYLLIETLLTANRAFDHQMYIHSEKEPPVSLQQMASYFGEALLKLFKKDKQGRRPAIGDNQKLQEDPYFAEHLFFYEYFHGDTGRGLGASHQTGWTSLVANLIDELRTEN